MCIDKDDLLQLCELFPQTAENIKRKSLERRAHFMKQKNQNSRRFTQKLNINKKSKEDMQTLNTKEENQKEYKENID